MTYKRSTPTPNRGRQVNVTSAQTPPDFRLNFLRLTLSATSLTAGVLPFESVEQLRDLRDTHTATHVVHRQGDDLICVPLVANAPVLGELRTFHRSDASSLVQRLIREAVLRFLEERGYTFTDVNPPTFVVRDPRRDLLARAADAAGSAVVDWLHVYPEYSFAPRCLYPRQREPQFGILLNCWTHYEIDGTVADLIADGFDVRGRYVRVADQEERAYTYPPDPIALLHLAGCVRDVVGTNLLLEDAPRLSEVVANEAWLEARRENVEACLRFSGPPNVESVLHCLEEEIFQMTGGSGRLERSREVVSLLRNQGTFLLASDLTCTFEDLLEPRQGHDVGTYRRLPRPTFVFDPAGSKTHYWHDKGLEEFGPFDTESFATKRPCVAVVTPKAYKGDVEVFLRKFKEGLPREKAFTQGFVRKYHLHDCTFQFALFDPSDREAQSYRQACLSALRATPRPDLAFVVIQDRHKELAGDDNPYLVSKSVFMSQGVPVQEVEIETVCARGASVPYTLNNIGLACYAKLGGIPFAIVADPALAHELVIGIGSTTIRTGRLSGTERVVGITTVFSADGTYLLYNTSREVDFDDYPAELLTTLKASVEQIRLRNAWQPGDSVRLIFHVFKPLRDVEAQAVKALVEHLVDFQVEFAFIHISEDHDWMLFDQNSAGIDDWQVVDPRLRGRRKGALVPERGYAVPLDRRSILLSVTGPRQLKTPLQGCPRPLLLNLHRESTFESLEYLAGQVYRFTALSWRSFFPANRPVTILYSGRIAELLGQLRHVTNWNPDVLATTLRGSRWFL